MKTFTLNIPISKVDEEQRIVYGYATKEELDRQGDIVDYEASKKAFSAWAGNIREQHDPKRVIGKKVSMEFDDDEKQVLVGAYISKSPDGEGAWTKVKEGLFTGFSIGGKIKSIVKEKLTKDGAEVSANRIMDYDLAELSLVDVPACPSAQLVMVKSVDGQAHEVEELHQTDNGQPLPWFMKAFAYAPDQVNHLAKTSDNQSMEKKDYSDKEREAMAENGEALPDGSFPIKTVADLKNAIKAVGRAKDEAKAKAHIIKRAKALGRTDLLPEDWNTKGVDAEMQKTDEPIEKTNVIGGEERDANAQPVKAEEPADKPVEKVNVMGGEERDSNGQPVKQPEDKPAKEVKKGLYTVADLAACVENLQYIVQSAEFEAQYEGDGSEVPAKLKAAVAQVGAVLVEMTAEEVQEAAGGKDVEVEEEVELADRPTDLRKMVAQELEATQGALLKAVGDAVAGKVAEALQPLEDRIKSLESQPASGAPKRSYVEVDKVADKPTEQDELMQKAAEMEAHPERFDVLERADLATELFKRSSHSRPIKAQ